MVRTATSSGLSVSSTNSSRSTSGKRDLGADTISRLELRSGQIRTCCEAVWALELLGGGELLPLSEGGLPPGNGIPGGPELLRLGPEEDLDDGPAGWAFRISTRRLPNSSASPCLR